MAARRTDKGEGLTLRYYGDSVGTYNIYTFGFSTSDKSYYMPWSLRAEETTVQITKYKVGNVLIEDVFKPLVDASIDREGVKLNGDFSITR